MGTTGMMLILYIFARFMPGTLIPLGPGCMFPHSAIRTEVAEAEETIRSPRAGEKGSHAHGDRDQKPRGAIA
jgi:hypothetical protein